MTLPLSKYLDPADFAELAGELAIVDQHFTQDREQHPMRRWEYAMALRAYSTWQGAKPFTSTAVDVGGAGSPFWRMLPDSDLVATIDPDAYNGETLAEYVQGDRARLFPAVFCLSVLEHVKDLDQFLYHLSCLTAPSGLLFLTFDACNGADHPTLLPPPCHTGIDDPHHFHWMRHRIFVPCEVGDMIAQLTRYQFHFLGSPSAIGMQYQPTVYDYGFHSLAMVKRS